MQKPQLTWRFSYHWYIRIISVVAIVIFGAMGVVSLTGWGGAQQNLGAGLFFLCCVAAGLLMSAWTNRSFETDQAGIRKRSWFGRQVSLPWVDIAKVESSTFNPSLRLTDIAGQTKISIDTWISNYEQLVEQVRQARPDLWDTVGTTEFHRSPWLTALGVLMALAFMGFGLSGLFKSQIAAGAALGGIGMLVLYFTLRLPQQVCLEGNSLRLKYLVGERIVHARDISNISIAVVRDIQGGSGASVNIILEDGKRIDLAGFNVGTPVLANTLQKWWERANPNTVETQMR